MVSHIEVSRLHEQHEAVFDLMHGRPVHAPLQSPKKILDIGCGVNADMTLLLSKTYPSAIVYAVDISPAAVSLPSNVVFIHGNITTMVAQKDPRLPVGEFDYVFSRFLIGAVKNWSDWIHNTIGPLLTPGGWMELHDSPHFEWYNRKTGEHVSRDWKWLRIYQQHAEKHGLGGYAGRQLKSELPDILHRAPTGLEDIQTRWYQTPWAPVPGRPETEKFATYALGTLKDTFSAAVDKIVPAEQLGEVIQGIQETMGKRMEDVYMPILVVWAKRVD